MIIRAMEKHLVLAILGILGSAVVISFVVAAPAFAQNNPYSEEYMTQHDGGDRAEYLQEMQHSDPRFYVPPVNDASLSGMDNNLQSDSDLN
jgi:hypothetical protein